MKGWSFTVRRNIDSTSGRVLSKVREMSYCLFARVDVIEVFVAVLAHWPELLVQADLVKDLLSAVLLEDPCSFSYKNLLVLWIFHAIDVHNGVRKLLKHILFNRYSDELGHRLVQRNCFYFIRCFFLFRRPFFRSLLFHLYMLFVCGFFWLIDTWKPIINFVYNFCRISNRFRNQSYAFLDILERIHVVSKQSLSNTSNLINIIGQYFFNHIKRTDFQMIRIWNLWRFFALSFCFCVVDKTVEELLGVFR